MAYTKEQIINLIDTNDRAVVKALIRIYSNQTSVEQVAQQTKESNGIGFNSADARILTYRAQYAKRTGSLSGSHLIDTRRRIKKYWAQLLAYANSHATN